jgi:hypothetical protein
VASGHELVERCWPDGLLNRVLDLWAQRQSLLGALEQLPPTFCHLDAFPRNLFIDDKLELLTALDWSFAGIAGVGTELAPMVAASVSFYDAEPHQAGSIDGLVYEGYLKGLACAGWDGDPRLVRFGYTAAASLRYGLFPMGVFLSNEHLRAHFEQLFSHPASDVADRWAEASAFLLDQSDEARSLVRLI